MKLQALIVLCFAFSVGGLEFCDLKFEGFGAFLGAVGHLERSPVGVSKKVIDLLYNDLQLRYYRTSYEQYFSPSPNVYEIKCNDGSSCMWDEVQREIAKYENISVFASIWIAPYYMMNMPTYELPEENELAYLYYIRNITEIMQTQYNITIENVSPINEPENVFAAWDHTNVSPAQLCRMVADFNDPKISLCPENSYFWVSEWYKDFNESTRTSLEPTCGETCKIHVTHAYAPNLDPTSSNFPLAYYDLTEYTDRGTDKHIWMTEISSTWHDAHLNQMKEAIDMSTNIVNLVGSTCIQRYYFWYAYTKYYSGESLIWGDDNGHLTLPKKYHAYKHFTVTHAEVPKPVHVRRCDEWATIKGVMCLSNYDLNAVFVNPHDTSSSFINMEGKVCGKLCCTSERLDFACDISNELLPAKSICSCHDIRPKGVDDSGVSSVNQNAFQLISSMIFISFIFRKFQ